MLQKTIYMAVLILGLGVSAYAEDQAAQPQAQAAVQNEAAATANPAEVKPSEAAPEGGIKGWWHRFSGNKGEKIENAGERKEEAVGKI